MKNILLHRLFNDRIGSRISTRIVKQATHNWKNAPRRRAFFFAESQIFRKYNELPDILRELRLEVTRL